ncbi:RNA polymerase sigma factor FliA [Vibrio alginolyticus]|uniref:RNA polymerase sigma factor FliA n=1 Tax=Vibrio sp. B1FLJ16 TaxID=2751178 RepID=UPI0015F40CE4|nr:RNA polymerase sigma factor FliA [Vibrio sp. B1FLJ16]MCA0934583.1 RNA polymerase sigma factor FliA [Vibrio alginolyticus]CAD7809206.1 Sigma factors are initiation factors that promote the attachment of RNA polymerase to specific initiation sites and are then released. This sigma factor controls the expression of flagella-related genes [Vibrio sp. B1FLJ16]CAD7809952.1 Sigma factors are initiation factors that promote the attachment of RNA polymerase to specific initiation sites and are then re
MNNAVTYDQNGKFNSQRAFIERYSVLVKRIAHHLLGRLPPSVQVEDLIQAGMIGLIEAQQNYDATKGASFETYAGIRIRGAMLDDMRKGDWVPRSVHKNNREINQAIAELEGILNRDPTDSEVAAHLGMTLDQYHSALTDINCSKLVGIEDLGVSDDVISPADESDNSNPFKGVADESFRKALVESIKQLPEREALVLSLYYDEELNLKEIGDVLGVSESRVSQILSQSMQRLRTKLSAWTQNN